MQHCSVSVNVTAQSGNGRRCGTLCCHSCCKAALCCGDAVQTAIPPPGKRPCRRFCLANPLQSTRGFAGTGICSGLPLISHCSTTLAASAFLMTLQSTGGFAGTGICGGVLVHPQVVLTAATCTHSNLGLDENAFLFPDVSCFRLQCLQIG